MQPDPTTFLFLILLGGVGGFLAGLMGVGGGMVFVPLLTHFLVINGVKGNDLVMAVLANSHFAIIFSGLSGSFKQYMMKNFHPKQIFQTAWPGMLIALLIIWSNHQWHWYNKERFTIFFISLLLFIAIRLFIKRKNESYSTQALESPPYKFQIIGFVSGIITALSGLGGGILMVPAFSEFLKMDLRKATGISTGVIVFFAAAQSLFYAFSSPSNWPKSLPHQGFIVFSLVAPVIIGVLIAAPVGVRASHRMSKEKLTIWFVLFTLAVSAKLLFDFFLASPK